MTSRRDERKHRRKEAREAHLRILYTDLPLPNPGGLSLTPGELEHVKESTQVQVEKIEPVSRLADEVGREDFVDRMATAKRTYATRARGILTLLWVAQFGISAIFTFCPRNAEEWHNFGLVFGWALIPIGFTLVFVLALLGFRRAWKANFGNLAVVPLYYALIKISRADLSPTARHGKQRKRAVSYLERAARWVQRIPSWQGRHVGSARGLVNAACYKKANYIRSLKLYVLMPTPLSKNDLIYELSNLIRTILNDGWQALPEADLIVNKTLNRLQRVGYSILGLVLLTALVSTPLWTFKLGVAGAVVSLLLGGALVAVLGRLGIELNNLNQAAEVAGKLGKQD